MKHTHLLVLLHKVMTRTGSYNEVELLGEGGGSRGESGGGLQRAIVGEGARSADSYCKLRGKSVREEVVLA